MSFNNKYGLSRLIFNQTIETNELGLKFYDILVTEI